MNKRCCLRRIHAAILLNLYLQKYSNILTISISSAVFELLLIWMGRCRPWWVFIAALAIHVFHQVAPGAVNPLMGVVAPLF